MIKSYSKINLSLRVLKKLKTGMHDIQSNSVLVDLHDKIYVTNSKKKKISLYSKVNLNILFQSQITLY